MKPIGTLKDDRSLRPVAPQIPDRKLSPWCSTKILNGPVVRIFSVAQRLRDYLENFYTKEMGSGALLALVTVNGTIEIFNVLMRRAIFVFESGLQKITWGDIFFPTTLPQPVLLLYSRNAGFFGKALQDSNDVKLKFKQLEVDIHMGLSVPASFESFLIIPCGMHYLKFFKDFSMPNEEREISASGKIWLEGAVAVIKPIEDGSNMALIGTDDGRLTVINGHLENPATLSFLDLAKCAEKCSTSATNIVPISIDGDSTLGTFVVGTDSKVVFVVKWNRENISLEFQQRVGLVNPGISTLSLRPDKNIIVLGGWDGQVRYLSFPQMSRLVTLKAHSSSLKCFHFFHHSTLDGKLKYYLASTCEGRLLTFWDIYNKS